MKSKWQKFKDSGNYCRKLKRLRDDVKTASALAVEKKKPGLRTNNAELALLPTGPVCANNYSSSSSESDHENIPMEYKDSDDEIVFSPGEEEEYSPDEHDDFTIDIPIEFVGCDLLTQSKANTFQDFLRKWANNYNIRQNALKPLMQNLNHYFNAQLPKDPRTFLCTPVKPSLKIIPLCGGLYWHQGLEYCLRSCFATLNKSISIAINFNVDGLPLYNSSRDQFWPILFNVHDMPHIPPMIIALFYGKTKPNNVEDYLQKFVNELNSILEAGGLMINGFLLTITIRALICDSPARAMIKG